MAIFFIAMIAVLLVSLSNGFVKYPTWYVKSENGDCPTYKAKCKCLADYITEPTKYFTNDSSFIFLQGTHNLSNLLSINGVHNLSLTSYMDRGGVNIQCVESGGGIIFNNSLDINISCIHLISCGKGRHQGALEFDNVAGITQSECH